MRPEELVKLASLHTSAGKLVAHFHKVDEIGGTMWKREITPENVRRIVKHPHLSMVYLGDILVHEKVASRQPELVRIVERKNRTR
jgi:(2Fe-2S) ferredoxin